MNVKDSYEAGSKDAFNKISMDWAGFGSVLGLGSKGKTATQGLNTMATKAANNVADAKSLTNGNVTNVGSTMQNNLKENLKQPSTKTLAEQINF